MESLGGTMKPGRPVAVSSGTRTHVFAVAAGGFMNHWISTQGGPWSGPSTLPGGNLAESLPCAMVLADGSAHVFAVGNGGALTWWSSVDGVSWALPRFDQRAPGIGYGTGLAVASLNGIGIEVFAVTSSGIRQYSFGDSRATLTNVTTLPGSNVPPCALAVVSSRSGELDLFAAHPNVDVPGHWHFDRAWTPPLALAGPPLHHNQYTGFAAGSTGPGQVELFAITADNGMTNWSLKGPVVLARPLPRYSWDLPNGVPAVVSGTGKLDVFAIGQGGTFNGGPLVHWRFADGDWAGPVAYDASLSAGGVGAVRGTSGLEAFAFQSGTDNSLQHWPAGIELIPHRPWENWARNQRTDPVEGHVYPTCLEELVAIVKTASQKNKRARAVGSSWSFSDVAVTPGYVVETSKLNRVLHSILPKAIRLSDATDDRGSSKVPELKHLVHVEAGVQLEDLMTHLDMIRMAPFTMGGASGQTLGGVISTSVHGSHFRLPPFPDWVRAIHLVGPDGRQYWIEPEDRPITDPVKLRAALDPEVTIKYRDDWFDAALVSVGSLGIVYAVVLEVRDEYKLSESREALKWKTVREQIMSPESKAFGKTGVDAHGVVRPVACVAVTIDPGTVDGDNSDCILMTRVAVPFSDLPSLKPTLDPLGAFCESDHLLEFLFEAARAGGANPISALLIALPAVPAVVALALLLPPAAAALSVLATAAATVATAAAATSILYPLLKAAGAGAIGDVVGLVLDKHPEWVGELSHIVTTTFQGDTKGTPVVDIAHNVMGPRNAGECATRGIGLEIAFDADGSHVDFIDAALKLLKDEAAMGHLLGGWFSIRFVGKSRAILSPQKTKMTCMVEIVGLRTLSSTRILFDGLEALGRKFGGTQHWGMFNDLRGVDVARGYPRLNTWRRVRWELTNDGTVHTFDSAFTQRAGLSDAPRAQMVGPTVRSADKLDIFVTDAAGVIRTAAWEPAFADGWHGWWELAGGRAAPGAAVTGVSRSADKLDAFVVGTDGRVYTAAWEPSFGSGWHGWWPIGNLRAPAGASVQAVSRNKDKIDIFVTDLAGVVQTAAWEPAFGRWHGWWPIGNLRAPAGAPVHAVSRGADKLDIFVTDLAGVVQTAAWEPAFADGWHGWWPIGNLRAPAGAPVQAVSRSADKIDIFATDLAGVVRTAAWEPAFRDGWHGWWEIAGGRAAPGASVTAACRGPDRLDVFVVGTDGHVYTAAWEPGASGWRGWWPVGTVRAPAGAPVQAVSRSADKLDVFVVGDDGFVDTAAWEPAFRDGWHGWWPIR